jgi:tol-pal system protein YbgF
VRSRAVRAAVVGLCFGLAGCATRGDLVTQDRQLRGLINDTRRQVQQVQRELERLRADLEESGQAKKGGGASDDRVSALERRLAELEGSREVPPAADGGEAALGGTAAVTTTTVAPARASTTTTVPSAEDNDEWRRDVTREQAAAGAVNSPDRAEYLTILDSLQKKDCGRAVTQLNGFAANHKDSPLADNALYWAGRCYAQRNEYNSAVTKYYDVSQKYPKGDKAPASLWALGNLFITTGDTGDARVVLSKLIRDYPNAEEAGRARQRLTELER